MELVNSMEGIVFAQLDNLIDKAGSCSCERCRLDVAALALNTLSPQYVVTARGTLFARINQMSQQVNLDTMTAIVAAINVVKQNPRHSY